MTTYKTQCKAAKMRNIFFLTFIGPCIANIFSEYNQQDVTFLNLFISERRSTCFRPFSRPSSGAQNCTHSVRHLSDQYCYLLLVAPDDGRKTLLKHVELLTEINKFRKVYLVGCTLRKFGTIP